MDHYQKGKNIDMADCLEAEIRENVATVITQESAESLTVMHVKPGSKMKNFIVPCVKQANDIGYTLFFGTGAAVGKLISIAEIVKRRLGNSKSHSGQPNGTPLPGVIQANKIMFSSLEEHWEPKDNKDGLEPLKVTRQIPAIAILLLVVKDGKLDLTELISESWTVQNQSLSDFLGVSNGQPKKKSSWSRSRASNGGAEGGSQYIKKRSNKPKAKRAKQEGGAASTDASPKSNSPKES